MDERVPSPAPAAQERPPPPAGEGERVLWPGEGLTPRAAAMQLARRGVPVFPCDPTPRKGVGKRPLLPKESAPGARDGGLYLASTEAGLVHRWWTRSPDALIGMPCGPRSGVLVIDLDAETAPEADVMVGELARWCGGLAPGPMVRTQSGGLHLWFACPAEPVGNRAKLFGGIADAGEWLHAVAERDGKRAIVAGVDVRGEGGYVIVPPSVMTTGARYAFEPAESAEWELPDCPARLLDLILRRGEFSRDLAPPPDAPSPDPASQGHPLPRSGRGTEEAQDRARERYAETALRNMARMAAEAPRGARNAALNEAALKLGHLVGAGLLDRGEVEAALLDAAQRSGLTGEDGTRAALATIRSGLTAGIREPADLAKIGARAGRSANGRPGAALRPGAAAGDDGAHSEGQPAGPLSPSLREGALSREAGERGAAAPHPAAPGEGAPPSHGGGSGEPPASGQEPEGCEPARWGIEAELMHLACTDLGNAARFVRRFGADFRHVKEIGWIVWDGRRWAVEGADVRLRAAVKDTVRMIRGEALCMSRMSDEINEVVKRKADGTVERLSDRLYGWWLASQSAGHVGCIADLAISDLAVTVAQLDADPWAFNVANGTLRFWPGNTGGGERITFRPHERADLITKLAPVDYDPDASCQAYDVFLARVQPDGAARDFLHRWIGLSLTGSTSEQVLALFHGAGANGKSVFIDTAASIAGDYAQATPIETFLDGGQKSGGQATPELARLPGVRLLRTSEPERGAKLAEALVKLVTGGEPVMARHLNRDFFEFRPCFKLTISGNHKPEIRGADDGIWRRVRLVPWTVQIPEDERDPHLGTRLRQAEASGILNRYLAGLVDYFERGLALPAAVVEATEEYRETSDPLGRFLSACTRPEPDGRVQAQVFHGVFEGWAKANGEAVWSAKGLAQAMLAKGFRRTKSSTVQWIGLALTKERREFVDDEGRPWTRQGDSSAQDDVEGF